MVAPEGFEPPTHRVEAGSSVQLSYGAMRNAMSSCLNCQNTTENPSYCSRSCAVARNNKVPKRVKKPRRLCSVCEAPVWTRSKYCQDHTGSRKRKKGILPADCTLGDVIYDRHHRSSAFALVRTRARAFLADTPKQCSRCPYTKHVEICHVRPIASFSPETKLSEINDRSNLVMLCRNCHWELDHPS